MMSQEEVSKWSDHSQKNCVTSQIKSLRRCPAQYCADINTRMICAEVVRFAPALAAHLKDL